MSKTILNKYFLDNKIKIAHLSSAHPRDDIRVFKKMCSSLAESGLKTNYVVADGKGDECKNGVNIHDVGLAESRMSRILCSSKAVYRKALKLDCDLYHFHDPELWPYAYLLKRKRKVVVFDAHEDLPKALLSKYYLNKVSAHILAGFASLIEKFVCSRLDHVVGATPSITKKYSLLNRATNINNYPILGEFAPLPEKSEQGEIIYLGEISQIRGIKQIVQSLEQLEDVRLNLAGNFVNQGFRKELESLKGWKKVKYWGHVDRTEARNLLSRSSVALVTFLPEPNHLDSQPNKIFEYMSAGLPIVLSDFPLWNEIVETHKCGVCVNPKDPNRIAHAVAQLLDDPTVARKMGENGVNAIEEVFNWKSESFKLFKLYDEILKSG